MGVMRVLNSPEPSELLRRVLDLLENKAFASFSSDLFERIIRWAEDKAEEGQLLKREELRNLVHEALLKRVPKSDRSLWIEFFRVSWLVEVPATVESRAAELTEALDLEKEPLSRSEVVQLGVN